MRFAPLVLVLITGCGLHVRPGLPIGAMAPDPMLVEAKQFVGAVEEKMPQWDADEDFAKYESEAIATVKADIAIARQERHGRYFEDVDKLREDWNKLLALDEMLQRSYVI